MAHILCLAPGAAGHVNPLLGVVSELSARGHRISFATTKDYAARVADAGAEPVVYQSVIEESWGDADPPDFTGEELIRLMQLGVTETETQLPVLEQALAGDEPDLVLYDGMQMLRWVGPFLGDHWGVPTVQSCPSLVSNQHWSMTDEHVEFDPEHPGFAEVLTRLGTLAAQRKASFDFGGLFDDSLSARHLVFLPREFQPAGETFDQRYHFVGPCLSQRSFQGEWEPPNSVRPRVFISLGTAYNRRPEFFRTCMDAFDGLPIHVVLAIGDQVDRAALGTVPTHVEVHQFVPQLSVLEQVDLFVTHAGMGSTMEGLHLGVPLLAVPQMAEQRVNADRIEALGLGRQLAPGEVTAESLLAAALAVLGDGAMAKRVAAYRKRSQAAGGAPVAADVVEELL
ncbi:MULTISPECIES: macrolide family glycosyltransferase [unclassified Crossiella]|uniref:macrolide family glycosyltransferase n=1 Tax=unclassified Crossiella TaxID=2620835 RepID=UPI0020001F44|nr:MULTISPECIES: macrolide family glycosyltransferase [unclassified Crossiella]MCK2238904.1 glycosyl transferase [Crossiella sp. S99.2]MCK2251526.1 glycosyl transferase [Crossiella sp. S99.1]